MRYCYGEKISVVIENTVEKQLLDYIKFFDYDVEHGGIIVGKLEPDKNQILITDITFPQEEDVCKALSFCRLERSHQLIMDNLWKASQFTKTYLGEWHTHNEKNPMPSMVDKRNWHNIMKRDKNSDWLFFIIVGTRNFGIWTIDNGQIVKMSERDIIRNA